MFTRGEYRDKNGTYGVIMKHTKQETEIVLVTSGQVCSAFKRNFDGEYSFLNTKAKEMYSVIQSGLAGCKPKNGVSMPFVIGSSTMHEFTKTKNEYTIELFSGEIVSCVITCNDNRYIKLDYIENGDLIPKEIPYIQLTNNKVEVSEDDGQTNLFDVPVRSVQEIALEKDDITWLNNKKYYIVNDDAQAEEIFKILDNYDGPISYDTETTGLRMNCFGKINSPYKKELEKYNLEHPDEQLRADRLVGPIFCVEENISYYFPVFNRKFKNLYDTDTETRRDIINKIKYRYTKGEFKDKQSDMSDYIRNTPPEQWGSDVILMERIRNILHTKHIIAHNGEFEWKVGWQYEIDTNLKDDTMIMHQIMYKFRTTTSNRGEPSNLKYLARVELGIDQWELEDFFPEFKEDSGTVRTNKNAKKKKKQNSRIDFSYMDYEGTRVYAPTDGDVTFLLFKKYKSDMMKNHKEQEYLYNVEVIVSCCIGYMEFYGHRLDEEKIYGVRDHTKAEIISTESMIRQQIGYTSDKELEEYNKLKCLMEQYDRAENGEQGIDRKATIELMLAQVDVLRAAIDEDGEHSLNLSSPAQVSELFYDVLQYPMTGDKKSVASKVIKPLIKAKNEDGTPKYLVASLYADYKKKDTLMTKFFDNLPYYMYPGGYVFSHFGQISTATGRMSCNQPNAQQYPKAITNIVVPREGYVMLDADYSQIEYRVLTALAGNEKLAELFADPDSDYHTLMASQMYGVPYASVTPKMRGDAKSFNFGIPYGMGLGSLAILLSGVNTPSTREDAAKKYELYFKDQPKTRKFFDQVKEMAQVNKYTKTFWNRYRYYSFTDANGNENNARKAAALRQAGNAVIQGCLGGDTRIQTKELGIVKIKDVANLSLSVWDGDKWSNGDITYSGKKQKCIVHFSNGQDMICSPIHKFLVKSAKGNTRFVECKDLRGSNESTNPHRVVINTKYEKSDWTYSSDWAKEYSTLNHQSKNVFLDDIGDSFKIGVVLGRLASDGSILKRDVGGSCILQYIAEHEKSILPELKSYMDNLGYSYYNNEVREDRNEKVNRLCTYSTSLVEEVSTLDIKHHVHDNIFMDTELLRGFLRGFFDGDGGISGKTITLVFGTQHNFDEMCRDLQKALLFFGIRSRYRKYDYRHVLAIKTNDNQKFLDLIGFINQDKQQAGRELNCVTDEHLFGQVLVVESVEITNDYIDMYDVCNTDGGYYVADGVITHNTAADVFKISVARNFMYIRENNLLGLLLIINMIHDEQLFEINAQKLNVQRVLADVGRNMQFKIEGFPPLYIGAGIGASWAKAKGKMAEIHPLLLNQFTAEADNIPLWRTDTEYVNPKDVLTYFGDRVLEFRRKKVYDYLIDPSNYYKDLHPAIGNLLNLQFAYGHNKEDEGLKDDEFTRLCVDEFIKNNGIEGVDSSKFIAKTESMEDVEEDEEYSDDEDGEDNETEIEDKTFTLIDDSSTVYGSTIQDLIAQFGFFVSPAHKVCGLNSMRFSTTKKDELVDYLYNHLCNKEDEDSMELIFLQEGNILNRTGLYVDGISGSDVEDRL